MWRGRKRKQSITKDKIGYWKYHKDTQLLLKSSYGEQFSEKKKGKRSDSNGEESENTEKKGVAVLSFEGDLRARQHESFAQLVDEVLINKERFEEVVVRVDSPGGMVAPYGHVYSEMERIRDSGLSLTVCIDVVAASGGYLISLPAHKICAAPFAVVGSVGVAAFVPNIRRLLMRLDVEPRTFTVGKYKRTVNLTDEATQEEILHFKGQLESVQKMFLGAVEKYRPQVNRDLVETGDHWSASETVAKGLGLVDELCSSSQYLLEKNEGQDLLFISVKKGLFEDGLFSRFGISLLDNLESRVCRFLSGT